jgi:transcriptional regulator with XRE-family HTH domain
MPKAPPKTTPTGVEVDGTALRELRKRLGYTVSEFAPLVPISFGYLSQIERGWRKSVSPPTFQRLVSALGIHNPDAIKPRRGKAA